MTTHLPVIHTNSSLSQFKSCPKKYEYKYVRGFRSTLPADNLTFGTAIHALLDEFYTHEPPKSDLRWPEDAEWEPKGNAMIRAYREYYGDDILDWDIVAAEHEFRVDELSYHLAGKMDLIAVRNKTDLWFWDHKTAGQPLAFEELRIRTQGRIYSYAEREIRKAYPKLSEDVKFRGFLYNVLVKPKHKWGDNETAQGYEDRVYHAIMKEPERFFMRHEIPVERMAIGSVSRDNDTLSRMIERATEENTFIKNEEHCYAWKRQCEFYNVCFDEVPLEEAPDLAKIEKLHPELAMDDEQ